MKRNKIRAKVSLLSTIALLLINVSLASADSTTFSLNGFNISGWTGPFVDVTVNRTSTTTATFTFTSDTATTGNAACTVATPCTYLMGDGSTVALNVNASTFTVGSVTEASPGSFKQTNIGSQQVDGLGAFNLTVDNNDGFTSATTSVSFTVTNTSGTWLTVGDVLTQNSNQAVAAAHIFVQSAACTGACVTGFAGGSGGTVPPTETPEPSTLLLLGAGLIVVSALGRGKFIQR